MGGQSTKITYMASCTGKVMFMSSIVDTWKTTPKARNGQRKRRKTTARGNRISQAIATATATGRMARTEGIWKAHLNCVSCRLSSEWRIARQGRLSGVKEAKPDKRRLSRTAVQ